DDDPAPFATENLPDLQEGDIVARENRVRSSRAHSVAGSAKNRIIASWRNRRSRGGVFGYMPPTLESGLRWPRSRTLPGKEVLDAPPDVRTPVQPGRGRSLILPSPASGTCSSRW